MISFPDFFEKVPLPILITIEGKIIKCNPAFTNIFKDLSLNDILNRTFTDLISFPDFIEDLNYADWNTDKFIGTINGPKERREVEVCCITNSVDESAPAGEVYFIVRPVSDSLNNNNILFKRYKEEVLEKNRENYSERIQMAKLAFWKFDIRNDIVELSEEFGPLIGEEWGSYKKMRLNEYVKKYVHPADAPKIAAVWDTVGSTHYVRPESTIEFRLIKKDGEIINVLNTLRIKFNNRVPVWVEGVIQDISTLRRLEAEVQERYDNLEKIVDRRTEELKKSEEKLFDALKLGKLTTWEFNFETKKYYGRGEISEVLGPIAHLGPNNEVEVSDYEKLIHPDDLPIYVGSFERALKSQEEDYLDYVAYRIIRPDGEVRHLYLSIKRERRKNGRITKLYGTIQDITSLKKVEEEKERLNAIIEITPDIVAVVEPDGGLLYLNQSGRFFYGFMAPKSIKGINFFELQKNETKDLLRNIGFLVASTEGIWTGESELKGKNNQIVPVSMVIVAHFGKEGIINSYSIVIRNISAQKKTEQDLLYKNAELDTFVYRASHDLRGPIASLLGLYLIVQYEIKEEKALYFFEMFNKQIIRLNEIVLALINLTKIKESHVNKVPIQFMEIVNDTMDSLRHLPGFSDIQFNVKVNVKKEFKSDKSMITTIIQNLIENAIKYSKATVVAPVKVLIESHRNATLTILVEDKGIGIGKDIQGRVFDMFYRGHEISKGSGLGLYILKNVVEKLKGKITLESQVSVGTTFIVELPYII